MKRILTAAILIPIVLLLVFLGPRWHLLFTIAVTSVAALAAWEFLGLAERSGANPPRIAVLVALGSLFGVNFQWPDHTTAIFGILSLALLVYCTFFRPVEQVMADAATSIFCLLYVGFLLCVVWVGDIAALYVGRAWGRHKLAPSISPNKTWEGAAGSMAGSVLMAAGLWGLAELLEQWDSVILSYPGDIWYWLVLAAVVNAAAQVGDLSESALKRSAGVKDSGTLLPGHGGVLDRIDALLLAAPVLWYAQVIRQTF